MQIKRLPLILFLSLFICTTLGARQLQISSGSNVTPNGCSAGQYASAISAIGVLTCGTPTGTGAPTDATYITQTTNSSLSAEQALASLSSGIMRVATTTGVVTALTDSAGIAANISDETGTGFLAFATNPTLLGFGVNTTSGTFTSPSLGAALPGTETGSSGWTQSPAGTWTHGTGTTTLTKAVTVSASTKYHINIELVSGSAAGSISFTLGGTACGSISDNDTPGVFQFVCVTTNTNQLVITPTNTTNIVIRGLTVQLVTDSIGTQYYLPSARTGTQQYRITPQLTYNSPSFPGDSFGTLSFQYGNDAGSTWAEAFNIRPAHIFGADPTVVFTAGVEFNEALDLDSVSTTNWQGSGTTYYNLIVGQPTHSSITGNVLGIGQAFNAASVSGDTKGIDTVLYMTGTNGPVYGNVSSVHLQSGTTHSVHGISPVVNLSGNAVATNHATANYAIINIDGTSDTALARLFYGEVNVTSSNLPNSIEGLWIGDLFGKSTASSYPIWYDGGTGTDCNKAGVTRVNHFGIFAYYNPCFAKYTIDAANFERLILRWGDTGVFGTDNRAYLGVEVGGTGVNRPIHINGANLSFTSTLTPAVTDTSANSCGTGTQTIVGNDNAGKVTVIGSAGTSCTVTFAGAAFANAPSCTVTNETTAALVRATSSVTATVLAGVFAQNDVLAYICLGR